MRFKGIFRRFKALPTLERVLGHPKLRKGVRPIPTKTYKTIPDKQCMIWADRNSN